MYTVNCLVETIIIAISWDEYDCKKTCPFEHNIYLNSPNGSDLKWVRGVNNGNSLPNDNFADITLFKWSMVNEVYLLCYMHHFMCDQTQSTATKWTSIFGTLNMHNITIKRTSLWRCPNKHVIWKWKSFC